jgi:F-type H+-transporting ATPase subunit a
MSESYNYLSHLTQDPHIQKYICAFGLGIAMIYTGGKAAAQFSDRLRTLKQGKKSDDLLKSESELNLLIPQSKITISGLLDLFIDGFAKFQDSIIGKENRKYLPVTASIFLFILFANLLGLIPGMPAITTSVWITVAIALFSFIFFNVEGYKAHGFLGYLKHFFCGIPLKIYFVPLLILIFCIEIFSVSLRPLTLNLRLYWNISADHQLLHMLTEMLSIGAFPIYVLGVFVSFMQAFVFTLLSMIYILLATQHDEDDHKEESH